MKTKILVCSNSGIDYIAHSENIASIPVILKFSEEEQYLDAVDITADAFYNRMRMDSEANMTPSFQNYAKISEYLNQAVNEGYDQVLFLLASKHFSDLYISISIATSQFENVKSVIYEANTIGFPLAYMAMEANRMLCEESSLEDTMKRLEEIYNVHELFFFNPKYSENSFLFKKHYKHGELLYLLNGEVVKQAKSELLPLEEMLYKYCERIKDIDVIPFVLYTSKSSKYISILQKNLERMDKRTKKMKMYPMPPAIGNKVGKYSLCLGYVLK